MKYYSAIKKNEFLINAAAWMNLENTLRERNQSQKITYCMIPFICYVQNKQIYRDGKYIRGCLRLKSLGGNGE